MGGGGWGDFFVLLVCVCVSNACVHACERVYVYTLCVLERGYGGGRVTVRYTAEVYRSCH